MEATYIWKTDDLSRNTDIILFKNNDVFYIGIAFYSG